MALPIRRKPKKVVQTKPAGKMRVKRKPVSLKKKIWATGSTGPQKIRVKMKK